MYVYKKTEDHLWTVGYYIPGTTEWHPESDHESREAAAERCHYLNGGGSKEQRSQQKNDRDEALEWLSVSQDCPDNERATLYALYSLVHAILYNTYE